MRGGRSQLFSARARNAAWGGRGALDASGMRAAAPTATGPVAQGLPANAVIDKRYAVREDQWRW